MLDHIGYIATRALQVPIRSRNAHERDGRRNRNDGESHVLQPPDPVGQAAQSRHRGFGADGRPHGRSGGFRPRSPGTCPGPGKRVRRRSGQRGPPHGSGVNGRLSSPRTCPDPRRGIILAPSTFVIPAPPASVIPAKAGIHTSWERGRPARNTPKAWVFGHGISGVSRKDTGAPPVCRFAGLRLATGETPASVRTRRFQDAGQPRSRSDFSAWSSARSARTSARSSACSVWRASECSASISW